MNLPGVQPEQPRDDRGRPTDYRPEYDARALDMCRLGATDAQLAEAFDVSERTINRWRVTHESFAIASRVGKEYADERIRQTFYNVAHGYEYDEEYIDKAGNKQTRRVVVPPNVTALAKWAAARLTDMRETQRVEMNAKVENISLDFSGWTSEELAAYEIAAKAAMRARGENDESK